MQRNVGSASGTGPGAKGERRQPGERPCHRWYRLGPVAAVAAVGLFAAACSSGSPGALGVASVTTMPSHSSAGGSARAGATGGGASTGGAGSNAGVSGRPGSGGAIGSAGGGNGGSITSTGPEAQQLAFAKCMRANGVSNFPDPNGQGVITFHGIDPGSPQFQKAQGKCASLQGGEPPSPAQQAQMMAQALKFSQCMRSHGIADFPDPQSGPGGGIRIAIRARPGQSSDLDPHSPVFQRAQQACQGLLPGRGRPQQTTQGSATSGGSGS